MIPVGQLEAYRVNAGITLVEAVAVFVGIITGWMRPWRTGPTSVANEIRMQPASFNVTCDDATTYLSSDSVLIVMIGSSDAFTSRTPNQ